MLVLLGLAQRPLVTGHGRADARDARGDGVATSTPSRDAPSTSARCDSSHKLNKKLSPGRAQGLVQADDAVPLRRG